MDRLKEQLSFAAALLEGHGYKVTPPGKIAGRDRLSWYEINDRLDRQNKWASEAFQRITNEILQETEQD